MQSIRPCLHLLNLRTELALEVGRFKNEEGVALRVPAREREILGRLKGLNPGPLDSEAIEKIYRLILDQSVRSQEMHGLGTPNGKENRAPISRWFAQTSTGMKVEDNARVAFQGERGAFSEEAAIKLLGNQVALVPRPTFEAAFRAIFEGLADYISGSHREQSRRFRPSVV